MNFIRLFLLRGAVVFIPNINCMTFIMAFRTTPIFSYTEKLICASKNLIHFTEEKKLNSMMIYDTVQTAKVNDQRTCF